MVKLAKQAVVRAFVRGREAAHGPVTTDGFTLYQHGQPVAWKVGDGYHLSLSGRNTRGRRELLNTVMAELKVHYRFSSRGRQPFIESVREMAPLETYDTIELHRGIRPAVKGKYKGIWQREE